MRKVLLVLLVSSSAHALIFKDDKVTLEKFEDYQECQTRYYSGKRCLRALETWVDNNPSDAFKAGKMVKSSMNHWIAVPFFAKAKDINCSDEDLHMAVLGGLDQDPAYDKKTVMAAQKLGLETCFKQMSSKIVKRASPNTKIYKNSCKKLVEAGLLKGLKKKKCKV